MVEKYPYTYRAFGLTIASEIPVIGFEAAPITDPDVTIVEGPVPEQLENIVNSTEHFQSNDKELLFKYNPVGSSYVTDGNKITIQRAQGVKDSDISSIIVGICFGSILHQRRLLPLHASTVIFRNKCLVFAGKSGAGKSTLALAMIKAGGMLVADDVSVISFSSSIPAVIPAFPALKIWADSLSHLGISPDGLFEVRNEMNKYYFPVDRFVHEPVPINHIIILNTHNYPDFEFHTIKGFEKFTLLKQYTYLFKNIPNNDLLINHFHLASRLASKIPVSRLIRPKTNLETAKLIEVVSKNI